MTQTIGIIGAGGWGIALATLLAEKGEQVTLWCHGEQTYRDLQEKRESRTYLPGIVVPPPVQITRSLAQTVSHKGFIIYVVPSHAVRGVMLQARPHASPKARIICGTKGLEEESLKTMGEVMAETFGEREKVLHAFLSGPTFALEVARHLPAAMTVAAYSEDVAKEIQNVISTQTLRVYTSQDVVGVQMGGVIKNVIAIASGISDGLRLGQNARAALITRGLAEMTRLAVRMGADPLTLAGLPGVGDLILTCTGGLSRNRQVGIQIAEGRSVDEITHGTRMVAEGIRNTRSVWLLARRLEVEMPIVEQMYRVIYERKRPSEAVRDLMQRSLKSEKV
jgi:glycerol-3-phosphate dehydrogenase (NAD(P)+)